MFCLIHYPLIVLQFVENYMCNWKKNNFKIVWVKWTYQTRKIAMNKK